jgi:hypothetical protein
MYTFTATGDPEMVLVHASTAAQPHHLDQIGEDPRPASCMHLLMISKESPYASSHLYAHSQGGALGEGISACFVASIHVFLLTSVVHILQPLYTLKRDDAAMV